jgi:hypothetical protein
MKEKLFPILLGPLLLISCTKRDIISNNLSSELFPLKQGNKWLYVDSFFTLSGNYFGKDIFVLRADDSSIYMLRPQGEVLFFNWPIDNSQPVKTNSYNGGTVSSLIYSERIMTTNFPSYKIVFIHDDGLWSNFRQQEYYFTPGLGIIKGRNQRKSSLGNLYTTDSYFLYSYTVK